jgi:hypothetical protein
MEGVGGGLAFPVGPCDLEVQWALPCPWGTGPAPQSLVAVGSLRGGHLVCILWMQYAHPYGEDLADFFPKLADTRTHVGSGGLTQLEGISACMCLSRGDHSVE